MAVYYLYLRVSTKQQGKKYGLETQREFLLANIPNIYRSLPVKEISEAKSAKSFENRKFKLLAESLQTGDVVACYDASRLSRTENAEEAIIVARGLFNRGINLVIGLDIIDLNNPTTELNFISSVSTASYNRKIQNLKSKAGITIKKRVREWVYTGRLYGYTLYKGKPEINEEEAKHIRWIFSEYASGRSINSIALELAERGVATSSGAILSGTSVRRILLRPIYAGLQPLDGSGVHNGIASINLREENLVQSAMYNDTIITPDLFWMVNKSYRTINRRHSSQFQYRISGFELSGLVRCGFCNAGYVHSWRKSLHKKDGNVVSVYTCRVHKTGCEQHNHTFNGGIIESIFRFSLFIYLSILPEVEIFYKELAEQIEKSQKVSIARKSLIEDRLKEIDDVLTNSAKMLIDIKILKSLISKILDEAGRLEDEKGVLQVELENITSSLDYDIDVEKIMTDYREQLLADYKFGGPAERRELYISLIDKCVIGKGIITITYKNGKRIEVEILPRKGKFVQNKFAIKVAFRDQAQYGFIYDAQSDEYEYVNIRDVQIEGQDELDLHFAKMAGELGNAIKGVYKVWYSIP